jgi:hypothetical protein
LFGVNGDKKMGDKPKLEITVLGKKGNGKSGKTKNKKKEKAKREGDRMGGGERGLGGN